MEQTLQSIHILTLLSTLIDKQVETLVLSKGENKQTEEMLFFNARSLIILYTCSFLSEWEDFLVKRSEEKHKQSIITGKKTAKPAIDRIKGWTDLKKYRNTVLAHNFRDKSNNSEPIFPMDSIECLIVPKHISEFLLLRMLVLTAVKIISNPFLNELSTDKMEFFKYIEPQFKEIDEDKEMEVISIKINKIINETNCNDHLPIAI